MTSFTFILFSGIVVWVLFSAISPPAATLGLLFLALAQNPMAMLLLKNYLEIK
jgi:hypothetical protein